MSDDKITLHKPETYQIRIPGELDTALVDISNLLSTKLEVSNNGPPTTTLLCRVDQAALQSILRRLYSLGLPLISVNCIQPKEKKNN
ncbi:MAG: hypothetical protein JEZ06_17345 [Anaerolineaceae bacterium]|nr:hypothetical protein [Anaerolineaceae bacterium]